MRTCEAFGGCIAGGFFAVGDNYYVRRSTCRVSEVTHIEKYTAYLKRAVNEARFYPPRRETRSLVALALYSKAIRVSEAVAVLLRAGFADEAFGLTRTIIDISFTLRYIANQDTQTRADKFYYFFTKDTAILRRLEQDFYPGQITPQTPTMAKSLNRAKSYPSAHYWAGKTTKEIAFEPDTVDKDANGQPMTLEFAYRSLYRFSSHYVHPSIRGLADHMKVKLGTEAYMLGASISSEKAHDAAWNVAMFLGLVMASFYRCIGHPQPSRVGSYTLAIQKHLTRKHDDR